MDANKQIIFGIDTEVAVAPDTGVVALDTKVAAPDTGVVALDTKVAAPDTKVAAPGTGVVALDTKVAAPGTGVAAPDTKVAAPLGPQNPKSISKDSNLGVRLTMKKIIKSPVPDVLPGLQPNQPVHVLGALNMAPTVTQTAQQPPGINPAIKHPAAETNQKLIITKKAPFKPEIMHPASLPKASRSSIMPVAEKVKQGNFKERLAKKNKKSKKTNKKTNKKQNTRKSKKDKSIKQEPSKKQSAKMIFS